MALNVSYISRQGILTKRLRCTRVNNVYSEYDYIRSGVVQGSCLGPLLILIYVNDIIDCFDDKIDCQLYADDAKLYTELRSAVFKSA